MSEAVTEDIAQDVNPEAKFSVVVKSPGSGFNMVIGKAEMVLRNWGHWVVGWYMIEQESGTVVALRHEITYRGVVYDKHTWTYADPYYIAPRAGDDSAFDKEGNLIRRVTGNVYADIRINHERKDA